MDNLLLHMVILLCSHYDASEGGLDKLKFREVGLRHVNEKRVEAIESRAKYTASNQLCNVIRQGCSDVLQFQVVRCGSSIPCSQLLRGRQMSGGS